VIRGADALGERLARGAPLPPVVWIATDEALLGLEAADAVRAAARAAGHDERQVFHAERELPLQALLREVDSPSLFASRRLLELRLAGKAVKGTGEAIADIVPRIGDDVRLLVSGPRLDRQATESSWFARIDRAGWVVAIAEVDRAALPDWIGARLARNGQRADPATLRLIADRVEGNLLAADQEVRKLALLLPPGPLPADAVRAAVLDVDAQRALRCLHGLRAEGTAGPVILWALADALRALMRVDAAMQQGRPLPQALREARVWGPRERLLPAALRRTPPAARRALLRACARADRILKGAERGDDAAALEAIVLGLAGVPAPDADARAA
jgi:DNA polymerase-3 subunit delta